VPFSCSVDRPIFSHRLSIVHFWSLIFLYIWAGPHHPAARHYLDADGCPEREAERDLDEAPTQDGAA
jgi:hypothetical protein